MKIRNFITLTLLIGLIVFSCKDDDLVDTSIPDRDRAEVYAEDIIEIEEYLSTHFYNYEEFLTNSEYSDENDSFSIVFDTISSENGTQDKISLMDMLDNNALDGSSNVLRSKEVEDSSGQIYTLYYLVVREGLGQSLHSLDKAIVSYRGTVSTGDSFDGTPIPIPFNLTTFGSSAGVVEGFKEGLLEFKTSVAFTEQPNGEIIYDDHGIGAIFIPSGLGYFSQPLVGIDSYTPIFFTFNLVDRNDTDYDLDNIPSHLEDLNDNQDGYDDDTDDDGLNNFFDNDDDGDGVLTRDEDLEDMDLLVDSDGDGDPTNDKDGDGNPLNDDTDMDGTPNYLDTDDTESRIQD
ncbi:FKBP-type peptidyl-prolyl cis-trans isomerase [Aurantibacter sp.]|uniref:FKBP-type peptidyl-prolyl cis-trans isomerase n=1 Tax=Aurantibacter sp. TaxID=2807103 RepID=UPI0035C7945E